MTDDTPLPTFLQEYGSTLKLWGAVLATLLATATATHQLVRYVEIDPLQKQVAQLQQQLAETHQAWTQADQRLRANAQQQDQEQKCVGVLPAWRKALDDCRASLLQYQGACGINQSIDQRRRDSAQIKYETETLLSHRQQLNPAEQARYEDLTRRDTQLNQQILELQQKLQCGSS